MKIGIPHRTAVFTHRADDDNIAGNSTYLSHPGTDGNPHAIIIVTPNWNPEGSGSTRDDLATSDRNAKSSGGVYNDHPIGVWYDTRRKQWAVFNQDKANMQPGSAFNVYVAFFIVLYASMDPLPGQEGAN